MEKSLPINEAPRPTIKENYALQREAMKRQGYQEHQIKVSMAKLGLLTFLGILFIGFFVFGLYQYLHQKLIVVFPTMSDFLAGMILPMIITIMLMSLIYAAAMVRINRHATRYLYLTSSWVVGPYIHYGEPLTGRNYFFAHYAMTIIIGVIPFIMLLFVNSEIFFFLCMFGFGYGVFAILYAHKLKHYRTALILNVPGRLGVLAFTKG